MVYGNTQGIKRHILDMLDNLYDIKSNEFIAPEILNTIVKISAEYNREIMAAINRNGVVLSISIGFFDNAAIELKQDRRILNGVRLIHTHPDGSVNLSEADISALKKNRFDCVTAIGVNLNGDITGYCIGYLSPSNVEIIHTNDINMPEHFRHIQDVERDLKVIDTHMSNVKPSKEKVILAAISMSDKEIDLSLQELEALALTAGAEVVKTIIQNKATPDPKYMLGKGKLEEVRVAVQNSGAETLIMDNELSAIQIKHLESELGIKVIDRSNLILDIFASRASSQEGKLQVELAQLKYSLPKLLGAGGSMDKLRQGIGMRGPGEKKLETDRRRIKEQITLLEQKIKKIGKERDLRRDSRKQSAIPTAALVGYTNTGKSTIMNLLSGSDVLAENKLFATLDPVTRKVYSSDKKFYLLTDTVGFIRKLPHDFIDAFKSTLEESLYADVLLHVMDLASPHLFTQHEVVMDVLDKIGARDKPVINVYNKQDIFIGEKFDVPVLENSVFISATKGEGIEELKTMIAKVLFKNS